MSTMTSTHAQSVELGTGPGGLAQSGCGCGSSGGCGCGGGCACGGARLERPRWFAGQLVGPADLEAMQQWVLGRARRHNRMIHGWGVSCGFAVSQTVAQSGEPTPWSLTVSPGFALSACGDDIEVPDPVRIDIREPAPSGSDVCAPPVDPWCAPVHQRREPGRTYYLAVRYAELQRRPVPSAGCNCGCDGDPCEFSRIAESYAFAVLDELPDCAEDVAQLPVRGESATTASADAASGLRCTPEIRRTGTRACPDCCSPWVVIADLMVASDGRIEVDMLAHRRFLAQLGELAFTCGTSKPAQREGFSSFERETLSHVFSDAAGKVVEGDVRDALLAAPAEMLRGARASNAIRKLVDGRSVGELAVADVGLWRAAATNGGGDPDAIERVIDAARVASRIVQG